MNKNKEDAGKMPAFLKLQEIHSTDKTKKKAGKMPAFLKLQEIQARKELNIQ